MPPTPTCDRRGRGRTCRWCVETLVDDYGQLIRPAHAKTTLFILGADGPLGRDELIRAPRRRPHLTRRSASETMLVALLDRAPDRHARGILRRRRRRDGRPLHRDGDGLPAAALPCLRGLPRVSSYAAVRSAYSWVFPKGVFSRGAPDRAPSRRFYPTRLIRAHLQTLRSAEFVEASPLIGASEHTASCGGTSCHRSFPGLARIGRRSRSSTNILLEVGLSFIGVGVPPWRRRPSAHYTRHVVGNGQRTHTRTTPSNVTVWQTTSRPSRSCSRSSRSTSSRKAFRRAIEPWSSRRCRGSSPTWLRRIGAGVLTLCIVLALTFAVYWALPTQPANSSTRTHRN